MLVLFKNDEFGDSRQDYNSLYPGQRLVEF
jgi:hypothetical protein